MNTMEQERTKRGLAYLTKDLPFAQEYLALLLLNLIDLFATGYIFLHSGAEANALPAWVLDHFGKVGFVVFKFIMVGLIVILCEAISSKRPDIARRVITFGCIIYTLVVLYEAIGIVRYIQLPHLNPPPPDD